MTEQKIRLLTPDGMYSSPAFSQVAVIPPGATTILVGGQNAVDAEGQMVGAGDFVAQSRQAMENVGLALAGAGAGFADVVSFSLLIDAGVDDDALRAGYGATAGYFAGNEAPPLVTAAKVSLAVPGALIEVGATAAVLR